VNAKEMTPIPDAKALDAREGFETWWARTMQGRMDGSKYLARNAWFAALWWDSGRRYDETSRRKK